MFHGDNLFHGEKFPSMVKTFPMSSMSIAVFSILAALVSVGESQDNWPGHRGPQGNYRLKTRREYPKSWSVATGENIRWRQPLPETGHSGIAAWGDRLFLTCFLHCLISLAF